MLGETIANYMKEKGIKQIYVAEKAGFTPQVLGQMLKGNRKIEASEYFRICQAIGIDPMEMAIKAKVYKEVKAAAGQQETA